MRSQLPFETILTIRINILRKFIKVYLMTKCPFGSIFPIREQRKIDSKERALPSPVLFFTRKITMPFLF